MGVLAGEVFEYFEAIPVTGITDAHIGNNNKIWRDEDSLRRKYLFDWPEQKENFLSLIRSR
jgi:hypothetical protein